MQEESSQADLSSAEMESVEVTGPLPRILLATVFVLLVAESLLALGFGRRMV